MPPDPGTPRVRRVFISSDIEGVAGVATREHTRVAGFEYERARRWMTAEVCAAIDGVRAVGPAEIVVADAHGNGQNLLIDDMPEDVRVVRSWPRRYDMMEGIQTGDFDAALLLGYHASASSAAGVLAHTLSSALIAEIRIGGRAVSEAVISAALAGHCGAPVVMLSGDDVFVEEARADFPDAERVAVKRACGQLAADSVSPAAARGMIKAAASRSMDLVGRIDPFRLPGPLEVEVELLNRNTAEILSYLRFFERPSARVIRFRAQDISEAAQAFAFLTMHQTMT